MEQASIPAKTGQEITVAIRVNKKDKFIAEELQGQNLQEYIQAAVEEYRQTLIDNSDRLSEEWKRYLNNLDGT